MPSHYYFQPSKEPVNIDNTANQYQNDFENNAPSLPNYYLTRAELKSRGLASSIDQHEYWTEEESMQHLLNNIFCFF